MRIRVSNGFGAVGRTIQGSCKSLTTALSLPPTGSFHDRSPGWKLDKVSGPFLRNVALGLESLGKCCWASGSEFQASWMLDVAETSQLLQDLLLLHKLKH